MGCVKTLIILPMAALYLPIVTGSKVADDLMPYPMRFQVLSEESRFVPVCSKAVGKFRSIIRPDALDGERERFYKVLHKLRGRIGAVFVDNENNIIEDVKGHQSEGKHFMPLTPAAKALLARIKELIPDSEYIFIRNGQPLATATFNRHLKKCCGELGIEYRSSHKIRFSTASIMYKNGAKATELIQLLGHTTLQMTNHYLRNITPAEETAEKMRAIHG